MRATGDEMKSSCDEGVKILAVSFVFFWIIIPATLIHASGKESISSACHREIISKVESPDHNWVALLREDICSDGAFTTVVTNTVQLLRNGEAPRQEGDVFGLDSGGHPEERPIIEWLAPRLLQILIPNKSLIGLNRSKRDEINIIVKFNPDDPEERKQWLRDIGE